MYRDMIIRLVCIRYTPMGWLRLVGCLKIYVSLQNIGLFCRSLLQKRPIFLSILLIVATPYPYVKTHNVKKHVICDMTHVGHDSFMSDVSHVTYHMFPYIMCLYIWVGVYIHKDMYVKRHTCEMTCNMT